MKIIGFQNCPDPVPSVVEKWYDRHTRNWVVQLKDKSGCQVGNATYVYTKDEAEREVELIKKSYGLQEVTKGQC